jgi:imidazolonepropionase-like amidohydrolase
MAAGGNAQTIAVSGATVHTMGPAGTIENATIVVENGLITGVGDGISVPAGVDRIDASGMIVTPGLISPVGQLGLVEVGAVPGTVDAVQRGDRFSASFDVADAYNPRSTLIAITRIEGITSAVIVPRPAAADIEGNSSRVLSGLGAVVSLGDPADALTLRGAVMVASLGESGSLVAGGSRAAALMTIRSAFDDAIDYRRNKAAHDRGDWREYTVSAADLTALIKVLDGDIPLLVDVNRASDISAAIRLAGDYGIRLIVYGGAEAWMITDELAAAGVSVILNAPGNLPQNFDRLNARLESAAILQAAGVDITFGAGFAQTHYARNLTQSAGIAVANGLPADAALSSLTIIPARMYGVDHMLGSIEVGKQADLVIWPADPLELTTYPKQVFIRGTAISMQSRQTLLRDRYLQSDSGRPPAFRH